MNSTNFIKEFFGVGGYTRTPEGAYSFEHLLFVSIVISLMLFLAIFLGIRKRNKSQEEKNRVLIVSALLIDGFELLKIFIFCLNDHSLNPIRTTLPLFLCSIQLVTIPLAAFSKGRIKEASLDFVCIFGILGGILGTVGAAQNYNAYPVLSFHNVVSAITHNISAFCGIYIMISNLKSFKKENIWITATILLSFIVLALIANKLLNYNYMFLSYHDGTPYIMFYNLVGGNKILYPTLIVLAFLLYMMIFYTIYYLYQKKISKN